MNQYFRTLFVSLQIFTDGLHFGSPETKTPRWSLVCLSLTKPIAEKIFLKFFPKEEKIRYSKLYSRIKPKYLVSYEKWRRRR
jgi:hypothetical protein